MEPLEEQDQFAGGQLSSVDREWARVLDFPNADLGFFLLGMGAAGKGNNPIDDDRGDPILGALVK
jgi:hypothetical protein